MDFGTLLQTAKENGQSNKNQARYYSTKFAPPKKEEKKAKALSVNIQKFLARKEAEEKRKAHEANRKREELLSLRSKDKKATRRVNVMLKRTKSANQSVIEDAVDKDNTAVTLAGPSQPDEDDYGYVSQEAAAFYNKMMEKYNKLPDDPKFPTSKKKASNNLSSTKDRVKAALEREKEEAMMPHRRKRKHKEESNDQADELRNDSDEQERPETVIKKPKLNAPPPLNFSDLLKLAEQKQHEPIMIEVKPKEEEGPLLTKKQKREIEKERQRKEGKLLQNNKMPSMKPNVVPSENKSSKPPIQQNHDKIKRMRTESDSQVLNPFDSKSNRKISKISTQNNNNIKPKLSSNTSQHAKEEITDKSKMHNGHTNVARPRPENYNSLKSSKPPLRPESTSNKMDFNKRKLFEEVPHKKIDPSRNIEKKNLIPKNTLGTDGVASKPFNKNITNVDNQKKGLKVNGNSKDIKCNQLPINNTKSPVNIQPKRFSANDLKPKQFPPKDLKPKQFPPIDVKPKQFPPSDVRRRDFPPKDVKRKAPLGSKRRILDDDDEYDSEMDDFIDDGPEETEDYSKYIKDIFGYDKSKYRGTDDDVDNMESTFAQQMKEDARSTRLGILEDLEDIQREKEEKRRKAMLKKRRL